jgi:hypothetical protein
LLIRLWILGACHPFLFLESFHASTLSTITWLKRIFHRA